MTNIRILFFVIFLLPWSLRAQSPPRLTLAECHQQVMDNDPLSARAALLQQSTSLRLEQIEAEQRPQITWNAGASIQTEVVSFPFEFPGMDPIDLPLYRAQTTLDLNYLLYDGGAADARRTQEEAALRADEQGVTVELEKLRSRVNDYYYGILLLREKRAILENSLLNLQTRITTLEAAYRHGTVLESDVDKLKVEALRLQSQIDETQGSVRSLVALLGQLMGRSLPETVELEAPALTEFTLNAPLERPELRLFELQKEKILATESLITAKWRPKVGSFVQAGVGYPNPLNFFDDMVSPFAVAGVNFRWPIVDWKQADRDRQLLTVQSQLVDNQRASFEHQLDVLEGKFREDIAAVELLIERDREIEALQRKILEQVSSQLDNGVITTTEYLDQVNAEIRARLSLETHLLQLQQIKVNYLTLRGAKEF